ncbi:MAG: beta-galactosidase trimerization domain-containing protein [Acidobacteria bacterium]|nr:beta-galactosidase trimerization domain-containing protein [Acidobacteriota bacterium]
MRWAQLTLVEDDPGKFDLGFWLDYFKRTHSDGACLSGGGCVAYYPTRVPFHHPSAWLEGRDVLGELISGCRKLGMVVLVRTDPHATYDETQVAHPDWIAVDSEGKSRRHWSSPEMWVTCALGPYNFEFMTEEHKEIMARYLVDGIFINRWDGSGQCYCGHCRTNFKNASGLDLPRTDDSHDAARRAYIEWREQRLFDLWDLWEREVRNINPDAAVIPNTGGGALSSLDMRRVGERAPMLAADRQARRGVAAPWLNGKNAKEYRATMGPKPVAGLFSVGLEEPYRWKDSVQSAPEIRIWVLDGIANGMRPWFSKFSGVLHDRRWLKVVEEIYDWSYKWEHYLRHQSPIARVGLVYSQQSARFYGGSTAVARVEDATLGWYQTLVEARIPFEMVHDERFDAVDIEAFRALILPNIAVLSNRQCGQLRAFVERGGGLIASFETSRYDERGLVRKDFGLGEMFGARCRDRIAGPMKNSYLRLEHDSVGNHPLLRGLEDAPRIINGVYQVEVEPREAMREVPLTLIPSYPDLPMEKVFPRQGRTNIPEVYLRDLSPAGRVVYFPGDIDRTFWEVLNVDHFKLLRNSVEWATNEVAPVEVTGPGFLEVTAWENRDSLVVHLVNLTNPMAMKGPYREFIAVGEQKVSLRLPRAMTAKSARLLVADKPAEFSQNGHELTLRVPSVVDHEVLAIDLP